MDKTVAVLCVLWGDWPSGCPALGPEYVRRLRDAVARNTTVPHEFACVTDRPDRIDRTIRTLPLTAPSRFGILPKLSVYDPGNQIADRIVVFDLDSVVVGNLDDFLNYHGPFAVRRAIHPHCAARYKQVGGDSLAFPKGFGVREIWKPLTERTTYFESISEGGDERAVYRDWLRKPGHPVDFWDTVCLGQYVSFKVHIRGERPARPTEEMRLVSFHGRPSPHEVEHKYAWIRENWR